MGSKRWLRAALVGLMALFTAQGAVMWMLRYRKTELPVLGELPRFVLQSESGARFAREDLRGRAWIADFIFTRCAGPCPLMTAKMARLQKELDVGLLSFTADPAFDTPAVLAAYGRLHGADPARWRFVTGELEAVRRLAREGFRLAVDDAPMDAEDGPILHSTKLVLLDDRGRIRGYYDSADARAHERLVHDAEQLSEDVAE